MDYGFFRLACESPQVKIADCNANAQAILKSIKKAAQKNADCIVFPALSLTGCTCANLFMQDSLLAEVRRTLVLLAKKTKDFDGVCVVGAPIVFKNALFNCAVFIGDGSILAIVPQTHITQPGTAHFLFPFESARSIKTQESINIEGCKIPFGTDIMMRFNQSIVIAAELCADLYAAQPPSVFYAHDGACLIVNLEAKRYAAGQSAEEQRAVQTQSEKLCCAYAYVQPGQGESTTDSVFSAHNIIAENGKILAESDLFENGSLIQDIDMQLLCAERLKTRATASPASSLLAAEASLAADKELQNYRIIDFYTQRFQNKNTTQKTTGRQKQALPAAGKNVLYRHVSPLPFMPEEPSRLYAYCREVAAIQAQGLAMRMRNTGIYKVVIGISGGLDSALALLAARDALKILSLSTRNITAISMPCFGTSERTFTNAARLANALGVDFKEIPIQNAVKSHLADIGHNENVHNAVYENAQARERTQVLMDIANEKNALVVGTGDLSELALGWATYNGDQMSMYAVNASVPKTLVRALVRYHADNADKNADAHSTCENQQSGCSFHCERSTRDTRSVTRCERTERNSADRHSLAEVLYDILDTPVSPELLPPDKSGISQKTEELVGPYELHDFFLYYAVRYAFSPAKIIFLASCAFGTKYTHKQLCAYLELFYRRFFSQQFKRSCMPDGVSIGEVSLSPRGFWNMPSDSSSALWLKEIEELKNRKA